MTETGVCKIKSEYIIEDHSRELNVKHISDKDKSNVNKETNESHESEAKKPRLSTNKKKLKGQNKSRGPTFFSNREVELCPRLIFVNDTGLDISPKCDRTDCIFMHNIPEYLKIKPKDISDTCYNFETTGKCSRGLTCRFGNAHITDEGKNKILVDKLEEYEKLGRQTKNGLTNDLQVSLRKRTYNFELAEKLIAFNDKQRKTDTEANSKTSGVVTDEDIIKLKNVEKKSIVFHNKLVLSPLTTVGNLPFRRICKEYGADVTCGEMAMCSSLLQGNPNEWALVKRHYTEDIFGVQLCANNPHLLTKCGLMLQNDCQIDFIDLNLGCPIDLVYKQGAGTGLLRRQKVLESCVRNLSDILTIPLTVKTRTGVYNNENIAHLLAPKFREWGASLLTIHGRSREQRYTKSANWQYIREVAQAASPMPVLGNGDILSYRDYELAMESAPELTGVMVGRGALIKPWIFQEIREKKLYDISSNERLDLLKKYVNYGLEHWGSDNRGVENTRRFLLEWLSFLYRYVPVGILENPPQKINERPPYYKGRNELETLMASPAASDWVKISEMILGPVPEGFQFLPKHKANAYG